MWVDFVAYHGQYNAKRVAITLWNTDTHVSYGDLDDGVNRWCHALAARGVLPGDRVCLLAKNRLEHLTIFFACVRLGAVFVPLNFRLSRGELGAVVDQVEPRVAFKTREFDVARSSIWVALEQVVLDQVERFTPVSIDVQDTLMLLYTSGSTGKPKGVMLHAGMLLWNAINTQTDWHLGPNDISIIHTPFFHTGGYNVTALPLLRLGGRLILVDQFDPDETLRIIESEKVTAFFAVPTMFQSLASRPAFEETDFGSVSLCISGGAPLPQRVLERYRQRGIMLKQGYGMTEVGPNCFAMSNLEAASRPHSVGRPITHSRARLMNANGQEAADGEMGELWMAGPHVCCGYWRQREVFNQTCVNGEFRTGDLMTRDPDGYYSVVGRCKDMYISGGENVYPGEVISKILLHPDVEDAVILAAPDDRWGEVGFAFVQTQEPITLADLRHHLDDHLSRYKHPHYLVCLTTFPTLANGKIDRNALQQLAHEELSS